MPAFDVWLRDRPGGPGKQRFPFTVNRPDVEDARRVACFILDLPPENVGLVPQETRKA